MRSHFEQPYFVTPHAVDQFKDRIEDISATEVIEAVQALLNDDPPRVPDSRNPRDSDLFVGQHEGVVYYVPVVEPDEEHGDWPVVPTILGEESVLHGELAQR